jgi:hypothetical protein
MDLLGDPYFRFDPSGLGRVRLDEWKVHRSDGQKRLLTIERIETAIKKHLRRPEVVQGRQRTLVLNRRSHL